MLRDMTDASLIQLRVLASDWEDAIRKAAAPLLEHNKITCGYVDDIIAGVKTYGPYIVLTKSVALPHAPSASGALENAIGITTLAEPVWFGNPDNDPVKYLFCLSATDHVKHLDSLVQLAGLFGDEQFFKLLDQAETPQEVIEYLNQ